MMIHTDRVSNRTMHLLIDLLILLHNQYGKITIITFIIKFTDHVCSYRKN